MAEKSETSEEPTCVICGHKLVVHIDEGKGWRCHSIRTPDAYQCECYLRKDRTERGEIEYYDTNKRVEEHAQEFREGRG